MIVIGYRRVEQRHIQDTLWQAQQLTQTSRFEKLAHGRSSHGRIDIRQYLLDEKIGWKRIGAAELPEYRQE
ncbi:hypothetical protein PTKU64_89040 [Paraburkholderia terrae]|uniref:Resolvase/invertase-type recombinase catalytic domain-containing protein n=1 Tax=Paraburkholderia terrae TaxID=311230 RepID=A0ABN6JYP0_9BURK|nr:hypothetical protein PTKU64_89040 [Paraburkholderia terrae]